MKRDVTWLLDALRSKGLDERVEVIFDDRVTFKARDKIQIKCRKCNVVFSQFVESLLKGKNGCPRCSTKTMLFDSFVERASSKHGQKYEYDRGSFVNATTKTKITCQEFGHVFWQLPYEHLTGHGCLRCSITRKRKFTFEQLTDEIVSRDLDKVYDYWIPILDSYKATTKIYCRCRLHDRTFIQNINCHLDGFLGCVDCSSKKMDHEKYVRVSKIVHDDMIEVRSHYHNSHDMLLFECRRCFQTFEQVAYSHIHGIGCPKCFMQSRVSKVETEWLDKLEVPLENRQVFLTINDVRMCVDAKVNNIIYEFYGTYFHGDPRSYAREIFNKRCQKTMGEIFDATVDRHRSLEEHGYVVKFVWERDFEEGCLFSAQHPPIIGSRSPCLPASEDGS